MNRRKKIFIFGILVLIYILIAVNFHKIRFAISMLRLYNREKNNDHTVIENPIFSNPLEDILLSLENNNDNIDNSNEEITDNNTNINSDANSISKEKQNNIENENSNTNEIKNESYISILKKYNAILQDLRDTFETELNELIQSGIKEYKEGSLTTRQLATKYLSIGSELEKSSDSRFNKVLKDFENELKENNYDTSIIKDIKDYYTSFKEAKKMDLINGGMKYVK